MRLRKPFRRTLPVPPEVMARAGLHQGETLLAWAPSGERLWLLGTHTALHVVGEDSRRIPWETVERADWNRDDELLVVTEVGEFGRVRPRHELHLDEPRRLLELVRERVTASVVLQRRVPVRGSQGLLVVGRRSPAGDDEVSWSYEFDEGVDPEDPAVMAAAEAGLASARGELGL